MTGQGVIDRVPRTEAEESLLLEQRPPGWEHLLFGAVLLRKEEELEQRWRDHQSRRRRPSATFVLSDADLTGRLSSAFQEAEGIIGRMDDCVAPEEQERAFGRPGESGDASRITSMAEGLVRGYDEMLEWSAALRADGVPGRLRGIFDMASEFVDRPLKQFRAFVAATVDDLDGLPAAIRENRPLSLVLGLDVAPEAGWHERYQRELETFQSGATAQPVGERLPLPARPQDQGGQRLPFPARSQDQSGALQPLRSASEAVPAPRMGFFERRRAKKALQAQTTALTHWRSERDAGAERLALAQSYEGEPSSEILLKAEEAVFAAVEGAALIEDRRGPGEWQGRSSGFSFPVASVGGRTIRYRTGSSRGTYVQGAAVPTAIDVGTFFVTNRRAVFKGIKQTRECLFDKLIGFEHLADGSTAFSVSNRQKPTVVRYGPELSAWFDFRLDLALAHYRDEVPALIKQLESDLALLEAGRPAAPASQSD